MHHTLPNSQPSKEAEKWGTIELGSEGDRTSEWEKWEKEII